METTDKKVLKIKLDDILPNRFQPRIKFEEKAITELAESIKEHGVIQPIVVRPIADKYEIIAGERRYKASVMAGKYDIPAIIVDLDDKESAEIALIENVQRQDLTPIEEAISYKKILDMGYLTQQQLATKLGKSQASIANKMRLLNLHEDVQEALLNEKISERHARSLLKLEPKQQNALLKRIINERLTVRKTDEEINKLLGKTDNKKTNLEVIDFEEKKEEPIMNDNFNQNNENAQTVNPGFMDLNKIEQTASNIFEPTTPAPVESLLTPSNIPAAPAMESTNVEIEAEPLTNGRFFNLLDDEDNDGGQTVNTNNNTDVFNFNNPASVEPSVMPSVNPVTPNMDTVVTPIESIEPVNSTLETPVMPSVTPVEPIATPVEPIANNNITNSNPVLPTEPSDLDIFNTAATLETPVVPVQPIPATPELTPIVPTSLEAEPIIEEKPAIMPAIEEIEEVSIPEQVSVQPAVNPEPVLVETPIIEEGVVEPIHNNPATNTYVVGDLKTVINTIRNCADTIEKYGYVVDLDEMDFEDTYQVVFKVQKKK